MRRVFPAALSAVALSAVVIGCTSGDDAGSDTRAADSTAAGSVSSEPSTTRPDAPSRAGVGGTSPSTEAGATTIDDVPTVPPTTIDDDLLVPSGDDPDVLGPLGSTDVELETDEGTVQIGDGEVPDIVPTSFPLPDDFEVQLATDVGDQAGFSGVSQRSFDELVGFYRSGLPAAGYEVAEVQLVEGTLAVLAFDGPDGSGEVAISSAPGGGRSVLVTFTT